MINELVGQLPADETAFRAPNRESWQRYLSDKPDHQPEFSVVSLLRYFMQIDDNGQTRQNGCGILNVSVRGLFLVLLGNTSPFLSWRIEESAHHRQVSILSSSSLFGTQFLLQIHKRC